MSIKYQEVYPPIVTEEITEPKIEKPLINSVVFVKVSERDLNLLYTIQGVNSILKHMGRPALVHEHEIQNLRILLQEVHVDELTQIDIQSGDMVEVIRGLGTVVSVY